MTKTEHYALPQWVADDPIQRTDFNDAFALLDAALRANADAIAPLQSGGQVCRVKYGSYTGDGTSGEEHPTAVSCDFTPVLLIVHAGDSSGTSAASTVIRGAEGFYNVTATRTNRIDWHEKSVSWHYDYADDTLHTPAFSQFNSEGRTYRYLLLGYSEA